MLVVVRIEAWALIELYVPESDGHTRHELIDREPAVAVAVANALARGSTA